MSPKLCEFNPVMIGVINAKLEPKYAGIFACVINIYNNVPIPDASKADDIGNPVKMVRGQSIQTLQINVECLEMPIVLI